MCYMTPTSVVQIFNVVLHIKNIKSNATSLFYFKNSYDFLKFYHIKFLCTQNFNYFIKKNQMF